MTVVAPPPKNVSLSDLQARIYPTKDVGYPLPVTEDGSPAWQEVLREAGYPTQVVVLDFETYFDTEYSLRKMSTIEYITDKRFEVLGVAELFGSQPALNNPQQYHAAAKYWEGEGATAQFLDLLRREYGGDTLSDITVSMHNARFDATILAVKYGIRPKFLVDTRDLSRHWNARGSHKLADQCKEHNIPDKGDTTLFKEFTFRNRMKVKKGKPPTLVPKPTDEQRANMRDYANNDVLRQWELFTILLPKMSNPRQELAVADRTLRQYTDPQIRVDLELGDEIATEMEGILGSLLDKAGLTQTEANGQKVLTEKLDEAIVAAGDNPIHYKKFNKAGDAVYGLAADDPQREQLLAHPNDAVRAIAEARAAVKSWPNHIKRVRNLQAQCRAWAGLLGIPLNYWGAHTGRWSGAEGLNLQNLGSRGLAIIAKVREMLIPPEGYVFINADLSAIEAVGLAWIAGQWDKVKMFENREEIYCRFAEKAFGKKPFSLRKPAKTDPPPIAAYYKDMRGKGKIGELGCGYGMGADKAVDWSGNTITLEEAKVIVSTFRELNPEIVRFWKDIEAAFKYTARFGKATELPRGIKFYSRPDCDVVMVLPNGRELKYHKVRIKPGKFGDELQIFHPRYKRWDKTWGGSLTENAVQAFCRDLIAEAEDRLIQRDVRVCLTVHDEVLALAKIDQAEAVLGIVMEELTRRPVWGPEFPVNAEGEIKERFCK